MNTTYQIILLLYKVKSYIDKHSLLSFYHFYVHFYINSGNIAWRSTIMTYFKPHFFFNKFKKTTHNYPTNFSRTNYNVPAFKLNKS